MDRRTFLKAAAAPGIAAVTWPPAPSLAGRHWRMATMWTPANPIYRHLESFAKLVAHGTDGGLGIEIVPLGEIRPRDLITRVGEGVVEMGHAIPTEWAHAVPAAELLPAIPFGLTAQELNVWFEFGGGQALADEAFGSAGCRFFPLGNSGCQMGGWFRRELETVDDLAGLRIRTVGLGGGVMKAAGAEPVALPFGPTVARALLRGDIDAVEAIGPAFDMVFGLHLLAPFYYYPAWHEPSFAFGLIVNRSAWDALPRSHATVVDAAAQVIDRRILGGNIDANNAALLTLREQHRVQLKRFPDDVLKRLASVANEVIADVAAKDPMSQRIVESILRFRDQASAWSHVSEAAFVTARTKAVA